LIVVKKRLHSFGSDDFDQPLGVGLPAGYQHSGPLVRGRDNRILEKFVSKEIDDLRVQRVSDRFEGRDGGGSFVVFDLGDEGGGEVAFAANCWRVSPFLCAIWLGFGRWRGLLHELFRTEG